MENNYAYAAFSKLFNTTAFNFELTEDDHNETGYFDGLVHRDLGLEVSERAKATDRSGRRVLVIRSHGTNIVLFERYSDTKPEDQNIAGNMGREEERLIGMPMGALTESQVNEAYEMTQHSLGSPFFLNPGDDVDTDTRIDRLNYLKSFDLGDEEEINRKIDALKIQAAPSMQTDVPHVEAKAAKPAKPTHRQTKATYNTTAEVADDLMAGNITPQEAIGCGVRGL